MMRYEAPETIDAAVGLLAGAGGTARVLAIVLGLSGAAVVLGFEAGLPLPGSLGDWLGLLSGIIFALSVTVARKAPEASGLDRTFVSFACAALVALPLALAAGPGPSGDAMVRALPLAAAIGLLWVLPATWLLLWGAAYLDPGRVSILLMLEVIAASLSASLLTDEPFGWREAAGCVLILSAGLVEALPDLDGRGNARARELLDDLAGGGLPALPGFSEFHGVVMRGQLTLDHVQRARREGEFHLELARQAQDIHQQPLPLAQLGRPVRRREEAVDEDVQRVCAVPMEVDVVVVAPRVGMRAQQLADALDERLELVRRRVVRDPQPRLEAAVLPPAEVVDVLRE